MSSTSKYKILFLSLMVAWLFLMPVQIVLAGTTGKDKALGGLDNTATAGGLDTSTATDLPTLIGKIVGAALSFLGVVFFILIIYGGYMWMFSMGNEQTVGKAKEIIIAAVVGLIIVLMAYAITSYLGSVVAPGTPAAPVVAP